MSAERPSSPEAQNEDIKPGSPPRHATDPAGGKSSETDKTRTNPATGEPSK